MMTRARSSSTFDIPRARKDLAEICRQVADGKSRVQIRAPGGKRDCVVISRDELESLERAIEILSNAREVRSLSDSLQKVAAAADGAYHTGG